MGKLIKVNTHIIESVVLISILLSGCKGNTQPFYKDIEYKSHLVASIGEAFEQKYVYPETGKKIKTFLLDQSQKGVYDPINNYDSLALVLKNDIYSISKDKHVVVSHIQPNSSKKEYTQGANMNAFYNRFKNFGLSEALILENNIGYLNIEIFYPLGMNEKANHVVQETMRKFKGCKALIFDLRKCKGGDPSMLAFIIGYLYPKGEKIHLNSFYYRPMDITYHTYSSQTIDGDTYPTLPVFVLTAPTTFSCAEEFAYDLKHLKRATIIGEKTGGGAHMVEPIKVDNNFELHLPSGMAINPITGGNWEGIGVIPDIQISAEQALEKAIKVILAME